MDYRDTQDWKGLDKAHQMGVSWPQIWSIIAAVALIAVVTFALSVFVVSRNSKMLEQKIDDALKNSNGAQIDIEKNIQDQVNQKLREAGIAPIQK